LGGLEEAGANPCGMEAWEEETGELKEKGLFAPVLLVLVQK
jgi:hypothetical protein